MVKTTHLRAEDPARDGLGRLILLSRNSRTHRTLQPCVRGGIGLSVHGGRRRVVYTAVDGGILTDPT